MFNFFAISFLLSVIINYLVIPYADKLKLIDLPDHRKNHAKATPLTGGLSIFLSMSITFLILNVSSEILVFLSKSAY